MFFLLNTVWLDTLLFTQGVAVASCVYLAFEWATVCNHESSSTDCPASQIDQLTSDSGCGMLFMSPCYRCCQISSKTKSILAYAAASMLLIALVNTASDPQPGPMRHAHRQALGIPRRIFLHTCDMIVEGSKILLFLVALKLVWSISQNLIEGDPWPRARHKPSAPTPSTRSRCRQRRHPDHRFSRSGKIAKGLHLSRQRLAH